MGINAVSPILNNRQAQWQSCPEMITSPASMAPSRYRYTFYESNHDVDAAIPPFASPGKFLINGFVCGMLLARSF
jgi:hypothetical protein